MKTKPWTRKLWGVEYETGNGDRLFVTWYESKTIYFTSEPTKVMSFATRAIARTWCSQRNASNIMSGRYRPVRVVETVRLA